MGFLENCFKTQHSSIMVLYISSTNQDKNSLKWACIHNWRPNRMITCQTTFKIHRLMKELPGQSRPITMAEKVLGIECEINEQRWPLVNLRCLRTSCSLLTPDANAISRSITATQAAQRVSIVIELEQVNGVCCWYHYK